MTNRARQPWPAIAERRRCVIETRTPLGEPCTLIVERQVDGPLIVSFHGAIRTTAAPDPVEAAELIEALRHDESGQRLTGSAATTIRASGLAASAPSAGTDARGVGAEYSRRSRRGL